MTKKEIESAAPLSLFRHVFGQPKDQKLSEFVAECRTLREDTAFVAEVRAYALANAAE